MDEAVKCFHKIYEEKTGNKFASNRFDKQIGKYYQVPTPNELIGRAYKSIKSEKLHRNVGRLLKSLMNRNIINEVIAKFSLDLNKMPLGAIKWSQINEAGNILKEIFMRIRENESHESLVEASNRFYSIIPHKLCSADVLISIEQLVEKVHMLKSLNGIRFTCEFLYKNGEQANYILDDLYDKLNANIEPIEMHAEDFAIIKETVENTKMDFDVEVMEIFKVERKCENEESFNDLANCKLLWHGTRLTNVMQIVAHGLKMVPSEAFVIGCMLGKGHYFSDVIANSAQYCFANQSNNIGILLLCEVALGTSIECFNPENIDELPDGKHSVHGIGKYTMHQQQQPEKLVNGVRISCGRPIKDDTMQTFFDYSEFVVYKNEQVKIKYLVKLKFNNNPMR